MPDVITIGGVDRSANVHWDSLKVEQVAGEFSAVCSLTLDDPGAEIAVTEKSTITIVDTDPAPDETLFAGEVADVDWDLLDVALDGRRIHLRCQDYNILVEEAVIDVEESYSAEADSVIIDDLFTTYRPDIDSTTHVATLDASMNLVVQNVTLREAMDEISKTTGGRWYVDQDKRLHYFTAEADVAAWFLSDTPDLVTSFPYQSISRKSSAAMLVNQVLIVGDGVSEWREDAASVAAYGERPAVIVDNSITDAGTAQARGDAVLARYSEPRVVYNVITRQTGLRAGMDVRLVCGAWTVDETLTVRRLTMRWQGDERFYDLELGDVESLALQANRTFNDRITQVERLLPIPLSARGWGHDMVFSAADNDTVAWTAGTIMTAGGVTSFSIDAGNTGNMAAATYVYLDTAVSLTVLQTDTSVDNAIGGNKILVAVCEDVVADKDATFKVFGGGADGLIVGDHIASNSVATAHLQAAAITTEKINDIAVTGSKMYFGPRPFSKDNGILLLGQPPKLVRVAGNPYWEATNKQKAQLVGGLHPVVGRWPGSTAYQFEKATTNNFKNPVFGHATWDNGWSKTGTNAPAAAEETVNVRYGASAAKVTFAGANSVFAENFIASKAALSGNAQTLTAWVKTTAADVSLIYVADFATGSTNSGVHPGDGRWHRLEVTLTPTFDVGGTTTYIIVGLAGQTNATIAYCDGFQLELGGFATSLAVGNMGDGYAWSTPASPHASTSTRTLGYANLSTLSDLVTDQDTLSFRVVCQAPYDHDAVWPGPDNTANIFDLIGANNANRIILRYNDSADTFEVYADSAWRCVSAAQTFNAGDWLDIVVTIDYTANVSKLYVNGALEDTDVCATAPTAVATWTLGTRKDMDGAYTGGFAIAEYAVFSDILTALEVAEMFALGVPLADYGAENTPGILLTSHSGNRIELTAYELAVYEDNDKAVEIDTDGIAILVADAFEQIRSYQFVDSSALLMSSVKGRKNTAGAQNVVTMRAEEVANYDVYATVEAESESDEIAQAEIKAYHSAGSYAVVYANVDVGDAATIGFVVDGTTVAYVTSTHLVVAQKLKGPNNLTIQLGDALGANKVLIQDSGGALVASIDSDGRISTATAHPWDLHSHHSVSSSTRPNSEYIHIKVDGAQYSLFANTGWI